MWRRRHRAGAETYPGLAVKTWPSRLHCSYRVYYFLLHILFHTTYFHSAESKHGKGSSTFPNRMNFRKSSERPLTPPPIIFGKLYCAFCDKIVTKVRMFIWRHCCVLYDPISHEMHVVQMFNMVIG